MKSYLCYIHTFGVLTPQLRAIAAPDDKTLPDAIMDDMSGWPALADIERIEICNEASEVMFTVGANEAATYAN